MWRFNIIYKEQGTISIIELLAHKQNPLQSKQVFWTSCGFSASAPARALLSFIFKTNALNIVMVRLVDAAGNNVTDYRADQPWEVLISAAAEGGEDLIMAQPDLCTRAGTDMTGGGIVDPAVRAELQARRSARARSRSLSLLPRRTRSARARRARALFRSLARRRQSAARAPRHDQSSTPAQ